MISKFFRLQTNFEEKNLSAYISFEFRNRWESTYRSMGGKLDEYGTQNFKWKIINMQNADAKKIY